MVNDYWDVILPTDYSLSSNAYNISTKTNKTRSSLPEDDEKETGCIELINKSLPHCKLIQGQRQQQQNESIIEINSDKELESIIQLMNETFQDNHLSNSIQNKMNPYGKQYTSKYTCKHLNITMNNNNELMKQTRTFLSNPYQQESQFIRNNKPYFKQTNKQEQQYDHINTNYDYDDDADEDDDQFYPSSNCQNEQWYDIIDHDCHKSNMSEVRLEKEKEKEEEEQLLSDLFFISTSRRTFPRCGQPGIDNRPHIANSTQDQCIHNQQHSSVLIIPTRSTSNSKLPLLLTPQMSP
ncbi:unnamed protein product [Schistosoma margrebowiei]|uniref:Uncharacterized protein n=1 Tax=Schistosoma margrebowiei TaxID=48269 RepID=A0A183M2Y5_9TREM|nr:unnamed protein product [Schistosoma margrebowiei]